MPKKRDKSTSDFVGDLAKSLAVVPKKDTKGRVGRPRYEATDIGRMCLTALFASNLSQRDVAEMLNVSEETLRTHFAMEYRAGVRLMVANVATAMYRKAMSDEPGSVTAGIFILKTKGGWREHEPDPYDKTGVEAAAEALAGKDELRVLTEEEFAEVLRIATSRKGE